MAARTHPEAAGRTSAREGRRLDTLDRCGLRSAQATTTLPLRGTTDISARHRLWLADTCPQPFGRTPRSPAATTEKRRLARF